jgi:hypothetical protein
LSHLQVCLSIAALLPNKLAFDVANRIRWLTVSSQTPFREFKKIGIFESEKDLLTCLEFNDKLLALLENSASEHVFEDTVSNLKKIYSNTFAIGEALSFKCSGLDSMPQLPVQIYAVLFEQLLK